jgi:hypothetical protein
MSLFLLLFLTINLLITENKFPDIVHDDSGEKIIHSTPAILESIEFVPGHEPVFVEKPLITRKFGAPKQQTQASQPVAPIIDEATGLPIKMMKVPPCWTPFNKRATAAFIYTFFRNVQICYLLNY